MYRVEARVHVEQQRLAAGAGDNVAVSVAVAQIADVFPGQRVPAGRLTWSRSSFSVGRVSFVEVPSAFVHAVASVVPSNRFIPA